MKSSLSSISDHLRRMRGSPVFRNSLSVIYILAASFILFEVSLRLLERIRPLGLTYYYDGSRYLKNFEPDEDFAYRHRPGYVDSFQGIDIRINSEGFRGPDFDVRQHNGVRRILILGDSVAFGWGVREEATFPALLQQRLRDAAKKVEVISAGVSSWNTRTEFEFLKKRGIFYRPDAIILVIVYNDILPKSTGHTKVPKDKLYPKVDVPAQRLDIKKWIERLSRYSYTMMLAYHFIMIQDSKNDAKFYNRAVSPGWEDASDALSQMALLCREKGIPIIAYLFGDERSEANKEALSLYRKALQESDIHPHSFPQELYERRHVNSYIDPHPNEAGHKIMADSILKMLPD
ncbi:MAG: SGNH/GDSL hydrolase family protein [Thermodesulfovibrionales bacterium]